MAQPHSPKTEAKLAVVTEQLRAGRTVLLQETHWRPAIAPIWEALFTDASVCYSAARRGPQGGWQGGVAILVPRPAVIRSSRVLVEGVAVLAT
eukprot:2894149-Alexandrium_andersonii.AAC.1